MYLLNLFSQGSKLQVVIFGKSIEKFDDKFRYQKTYEFSNANIKPINKDYPSIHPKFELILQYDTDIKVVEDSIGTYNISFEFKTFKETTEILPQKH